MLSHLTQHSPNLIGQHRVGVVQPASSGQALLEASQDGLVAEQHHQDPEGGGDGAGVQVLLHEHEQPVEAQRPHQLLTRPAGGAREIQRSDTTGEITRPAAVLAVIYFQRCPSVV